MRRRSWRDTGDVPATIEAVDSQGRGEASAVGDVAFGVTVFVAGDVLREAVKVVAGRWDV
jgi:hypothetical protein